MYMYIVEYACLRTVNAISCFLEECLIQWTHGNSTQLVASLLPSDYLVSGIQARKSMPTSRLSHIYMN